MLLLFMYLYTIEHGPTGQSVSHVVQSNRMDTDEEYVEEYDEDEAFPRPGKPEAKQSLKVKRYKDDTYRCLIYTTACSHTVVARNVVYALIWLPQQQLFATCSHLTVM